MEALDFLAQQIKICKLCRLGENRLNAVPGVGNHEAKVVFVGEGPGKNEDEQGLPFVGASGKFLDKCFASIGWKREDIFITNVVKCRPPENRDPLPDEVTTCCSNYLNNQIKLIKPLVIVTLGRHSLGYFVPNKKISEVHGKALRVFHDDEEQIFYPLYHPAAALYNGSLQSVLLEDFSRIPQLLQQLTQPNA